MHTQSLRFIVLSGAHKDKRYLHMMPSLHYSPNRSVVDSLKGVTMVLTATTILAGRITSAGCTEWDILLTMVVVSTAPTQATSASTVLIHHLRDTSTVRSHEKSEEYLSSDNEEQQSSHRLANENSRRYISRPIRNRFSGRIKYLRALNGLLNNKENETNLNSFSSFLVNIEGTDSVDIKSGTFDSHNSDESGTQRRSVYSVDACSNTDGTNSCKCDEFRVQCDYLNISDLLFDHPLPKYTKLISASHNHLNVIPNISGAIYLVEMSLAHNKIKMADKKSLDNFSFLEKLNLSTNKLETLDFSVLILPNLRELDVSSNRLEEIVSLPINLVNLFLDKNFLTDVTFLIELYNLQHLNLSNNRISYIPAIVFQNLRELRTLDLSYNEISNCEFLFNIPRNLETLYLRNNKIAYIPDQAFRNKFIENLFLENNLLSDISFVIHLNVATLKLNNNPLLNLNGKFFETQKNLRVLDVSGTNLSSMNFVFKIPRLIDLAIEDNKISCLPENFLQKYTSLRSWFIRGNQFDDLKCSVSPKWRHGQKCNVKATLHDIVIDMKDENINTVINCLIKNREYITKCEQRCNSASQILIPTFLILFLTMLNVF